MTDLSNLCEQAVYVEGTVQVYRCDYTMECEHQVHIFDHKLYCRVVIRPELYNPKFPKREAGK